MSEVIRISEATYNRLESLARGFDTPGNVIDRLLDFYERHHKNILLPKTKPGREIKIPRKRGGIQPKEYRIPILEALLEKEGKAEPKEVLDIIEQKMGERFGKLDIEILRDGRTKRWQKNAAWERFDMVRKEGLLKSDSPRGLWEITEKGRKFLKDRK